jgi:type IV secretion system T-DNA border endonuclease VirD2
MAKGLVDAIMGEIELRPHKGQVAGVFRDGKAKPGKGGSGAASAAQRARLWRAGQGGHAVVLKKIHRGGTHTAGQLANQLDYLFSKAEWTGGNIVDFDPSRKALTPEERAEIVTNWSDGWTRSPKNGHTTHLLLSLPQHVKPATARAIAADWAAEMFESGAYGDEWSYVAALHTDRSHPHVHIVVQNRGVQEGSWFYMAKDHVFNLDVMKERMATVAEDHGVKLETTSRVERGILSYGPSRAEIEAARREGRAVVEKVREGAARTMALEEIREVSGVYKDLAFLARMDEAKEVAARMEAASEALAAGRPFVPHATGVTSAARTIHNRKTAEDYLTGWMKKTSDKLALMSFADREEMRPEFNSLSSRALAALGDARGAELAKQPPQTALYRTIIRADEVKLDGVTSPFKASEMQPLTKVLTARAEAAGLDAQAIRQRLERGALNAYEERRWIKADVHAAAVRRGLDLEDKSQRAQAADAVDRFYETANELIAKAHGIKVEVAAKQLRQTLTAMTEIEARHGRVAFAQDEAARVFCEDMKKRYGARIITDLARGQTDALSADFPDPAMRQKIASAVVAAALEHEEIGLPLNEARAAHGRLREAASRMRDRDRDDNHEL